MNSNASGNAWGGGSSRVPDARFEVLDRDYSNLSIWMETDNSTRAPAAPSRGKPMNSTMRRCEYGASGVSTGVLVVMIAVKQTWSAAADR